ncbi:MAG: preprotein translocase subunit SecE [Elusimicrobiales bacterium]|nr:preprotein translocase subunit SecE [Elusimicrobiales bacterium]
MNKVKSFLKEVYGELKKVTWLTRKDVVRSTISVGVVVMLVSIYIALVDLGLTELMKYILGGR